MIDCCLPHPVPIGHCITCQDDFTCYVSLRLSANCLCDPAEGPEILVCWTECGHWEDSGNSTVCHQSVRAVEIIRWKERHPESPSEDAKTKNPAQQIKGHVPIMWNTVYSRSGPCRHSLWQNKVHCYCYGYINILVLEWNGQLPYYQSPPLYMIPRHFRLIHILLPIFLRSILVLSLTIFLMFLTTYLLFLLEFQIVHLNYLVSSVMDMQSSDLLAVTAELFHWQWWCWHALQSLDFAFIGATMKAAWPEGS